MDDLTKCLYDFVCDRRMGGIYGDLEYEEAAHSVELQRKKVLAGMDETQKRELDILMDSLYARSSVESEHLFRATLGLARELGGVAGAL